MKFIPHKFVSLTALCVLSSLGCLAGVVSAGEVNVCFVGDELVLHKDYKTGNQMCCRNRTCLPGTESKLCTSLDAMPICKPCPNGTYQPRTTHSVDGEQCNSKRRCIGRGMKTLYSRSTTENDRCTCDLRRGFCSGRGTKENASSCQQVEKCGKGTELTASCECKMCRNGRFNDKAGYRCKPHRNCLKEGLSLLIRGSHINDTLCGPRLTQPTVIPIGKNRLLSTNVVTEPNHSLGAGHHDDDEVVDSTVSSQELENSTALEPTNIPSSVLTKESHCIVIWILALLVALVIIVLIVVCLCCYRSKQQRKSVQFSEIRAQTSYNESVHPLNSGDRSLSGSQKADKISKSPPLLSDQEIPTIGKGELDERAEATVWMEHMSLLVNKLIMNAEFWAILMSRGIIDQDLKERIEAPGSTTKDRILKLVELLPRRGPESFEVFLSALVSSHQEHLAKEMDLILANELIEIRDNS